MTELIGGALTVAVGALTVLEGSGYRIGTLASMGPGFFPVVLGVLMIALGVAIVLEGRRADADRLERPAYRSLLAVLAGIGAFGLLIERGGLVPAVFVLVLIASIAEPRLKLLPTLALAVVVSGFSVLIFAEGLGIALRPYAWW